METIRHRRYLDCPNAIHTPWFRVDRELEHRFRVEIRIAKRNNVMPARSKAQQKAAGAALSVKRGEQSKSQLKGASRQMYESMSEKELEELAETKRRGLPQRKS
jgi:hypothetical protein